jgi:hypothetical protein
LWAELLVEFGGIKWMSFHPLKITFNTMKNKDFFKNRFLTIETQNACHVGRFSGIHFPIYIQ